MAYERKFGARALGYRQKRFINEYLVDCNATRAAIAAGYTKLTASQAGWEVPRNPKVAAELERRQRLLAERHEVTAENVISELAKIGFANAADFYAVDGAGRVTVDTDVLADPQKAAAISQIEIVETKEGQVIRFKLFDKRAALGDLSRHLGFAPDRLQVTVAPAVEGDASIRKLALAALALFAEAAQEQEREGSGPLQIDQTIPRPGRADVEARVVEAAQPQPRVNQYDDDLLDFDF